MRTSVEYACLLLAGPAFALSNPPLVSYVTYVSEASGVPYTAADQAGYQYVSGITNSPQFPCGTSPGPIPQSFHWGAVTKLQPGGNGVVWTVCLSGASSGVAVDGSGSVYVASNLNGTAVVTKLRSVDATALYATTIPSATALAIAVDQQENVYVTGAATAGLATTPGVYQGMSLCAAGPTGCTEGFVAKLDPLGSILYATFTDFPSSAIAVDSQGSVWIAGTRDSAYEGFYWTDGFFSKLNSAGSKMLVPAGLYGGRDYDVATFNATIVGLALDSSDAAYIIGSSPGPEGAVYGVAWKLDSSGTTVYQIQIQGATNFDLPTAIAVDASGNAYVALGPLESPRPCPIVGSRLQVLNADASQVLATGSLGAPVAAMALDGKGGVYVTGIPSVAAEFPSLATPGAYLAQAPGNYPAYAAKIDFSQPVLPAIDCVVNAASLQEGRNSTGPNGSVAPGELVTLFGEGFPSGPGLSVSFDGLPAPILYADSGQINAVVPFAAGTGNALTQLTVANGPVSIRPLSMPLAPASPGAFVISGTARLAALNQDGSVNSIYNPAPRGSVVSVFITGPGLYNPKIADGALGPINPPFPVPVLGVSATLSSFTINYPGIGIPVLFAGQAPGLVAGVVQVNLQIPENIQPGQVEITVNVGNYSTVLGGQPIEIQ